MQRRLCSRSLLPRELCMSVRLSSAVTMFRPTKSMDSQTELLCQLANYASEPVTHSLWGLAHKIIHFHSSISQVRSLRPKGQNKDYGRLKMATSSLMHLPLRVRTISRPSSLGGLFGYLANRELFR